MPTHAIVFSLCPNAAPDSAGMGAATLLGLPPPAPLTCAWTAENDPQLTQILATKAVWG